MAGGGLPAAATGAGGGGAVGCSLLPIGSREGDREQEGLIAFYFWIQGCVCNYFANSAPYKLALPVKK